MPGFEVCETVTGQDERERRAGRPEIEHEQPIGQRQPLTRAHRQLDERSRQEQEQPVEGAVGDDAQGVRAAEGAAPEHGIDGEAGGAGKWQQIAERRARRRRGVAQHDQRDPG